MFRNPKLVLENRCNPSQTNQEKRDENGQQQKKNHREK